MAEIHVQRTGPGEFRVEIRDASGSSRHAVTASDEDVEKLGGGVRAEELLEASFEFLLEREPKESILGSFDLPVIARYFPEYPAEIARKLA